MFDAADASDAKATGVMPGTKAAPVSNAAIKNDFKMTFS